MDFEKGRVVTLEIVDMSSQGQGIGKVDSFAIFVDGAIPGDIVKAEITKKKKNYAFSQLVSIETPSPNRLEGFCKYAPTCGGCLYSQLDYEGQVALKEKQVRDKITRLGGVTDPVIRPMVTMEEPYNYRNKAVFPVWTGGTSMAKGGIVQSPGPVSVGFYQMKSHTVVDCRTCKIQGDAAMAAAEALRQFMEEDNITAFDDTWNLGLIKYMMIRTAAATSEVMAVIAINGKGIPNGNKLIEMLDTAIGDTGFDLESVIIDNGKELMVLAGKKNIKDKIGHLDVEVSANSFYQVNPSMTQVMYDQVKAYAGLTGREKVLDLYCGVGSIGLYLADQADYVLGIEVEKQAVLDANRNAVINGIVNARYICGKAEFEVAKLLSGEGDEQLVEVAKEADVVILDPPRSGCHPALLESVCQLNPEKIVYMSCDPATLARDIKTLGEAGYKFEEATPFDNFPWTGHIEVVTLLTRTEGTK